VYATPNHVPSTRSPHEHSIDDRQQQINQEELQMTETAPTERPSVVVRDGGVHFAGFEERDTEVVALITGADDPVEGAHQCLRIGAQALRAANASIDADVVERRFEGLSASFDKTVSEALRRLTEATGELLDEETGALPGTLDGHREALENLLKETFDPESKKSVIAVFEEAMAEAHATQVSQVKNLVSLDSDDSPLSTLKRLLLRDFDDRIRDVRQDLSDLSEKIAVRDAKAEVMEITSTKGFTYEDVLHSRISQIAAGHADLAERVTKTLGVAGTEKGDEVVYLNREDTAGTARCFVFEAKSGSVNMRKTVKELDDALLNRDATAAIAVFANQDKAPTSVPFHYSDTKAIVVMDPDGLDLNALHLAYMWARWVVRREIAVSNGEDMDTERITALINDARRALERQTAIKRFHSEARNGIDRAANQVNDLVDEVESALASLLTEMDLDT